jgi:hypothetical protein
MTSAIAATGPCKSFGGKAVIINQARAVIAAAGLGGLASAVERAGGEDTGSEGASR